MSLVFSATLVTSKTHSKPILLNSKIDSNKCSLSFYENLNKVNSIMLNYSLNIFDNHTDLDISKSGIINRFFPKNYLVNKIKLKQLGSDLVYKPFTLVNYITHNTSSMVAKQENLIQNSCNDNLLSGAQNQRIDIPLAFEGEKNLKEIKVETIEDRNILEVSAEKKNFIISKNKEIELIAKTIWGEGRGESYEGKVAIGNVIINRYKISQATRKSHWWGNTIEQIILHPYQFSCHNHNDPNKSKIAKLTTQNYQYRETLKIAKGILSGAIKDNTFGATHYFAYKTVQPRWASKMKKTKRIGNHDFYKK